MDEQPADEGRVYELYQQGRTRLARGEPVAAAEVLELALESAPESASLHETLGRAYFATARLAKARAEFERALELDPSDAYAHFGVGRCHEREGALAEAAKHYKLACALNERAEYETALRRVLQRLETR
jgi:tetratricopeptide (TPR) repeat protein